MEKNKVIDAIQRLTYCSREEASVAAEKVCQDDKTLKLLTAACGVSAGNAAKYGMATTVALGLTAGTAGAAAPSLVVSAAAAAISGLAAKRFCYALVRNGYSKVHEVNREQFEKDMVR
jgi:hypothetical protein